MRKEEAKRLQGARKPRKGGGNGLGATKKCIKMAREREGRK